MIGKLVRFVREMKYVSGENKEESVVKVGDLGTVASMDHTADGSHFYSVFMANKISDAVGHWAVAVTRNDVEVIGEAYNPNTKYRVFQYVGDYGEGIVLYNPEDRYDRANIKEMEEEINPTDMDALPTEKWSDEGVVELPEDFINRFKGKLYYAE